MAEETQAVASTESVEATTTNESTGTETITTYADGQFNSVSALEDSYKELRSSYSKKLGAFDGAPEAYALADGKESNDFAEFAQGWGKDNQLNNDGFNSIYDAYSEFQTKQSEANTEAQKAYLKGETEKLGENANTRIKNAADWVKANLGEESISIIDNMIGGAKGIETIENIMKLSNGVTPTSQPAAIRPNADKIRAMRFEKTENGERRMAVDPEFRARVTAMEAELRG